MRASTKIVARQVGQRIRALRLQRRMSQREFAAKSGIHRTHVSLIECGRRSVRLETIHLIAAALSVHPGELFPPMTAPWGPVAGSVTAREGSHRSTHTPLRSPSTP